MTKDDRVRYTFRLPKVLFEKVKNQAIQKGISVNALLLQILWDWVKQQQK